MKYLRYFNVYKIYTDTHRRIHTYRHTNTHTFIHPHPKHTQSTVQEEFCVSYFLSVLLKPFGYLYGIVSGDDDISIPLNLSYHKMVFLCYLFSRVFLKNFNILSKSLIFPFLLDKLFSTCGFFFCFLLIKDPTFSLVVTSDTSGKTTYPPGRRTRRTVSGMG